MTAVAITVYGLALYLFLCGVTVLTGHGLLRLLRVKTTDEAAALLAPLVGFAGWALVLGITGGLHLPVKTVAPWLWAVSGLLALQGVWRPWAALRTGGPLLLLGVAVPMAVMPSYFWHGLTEFGGGIAPDGWSYIAGGSFFWDALGKGEGTLGPLQQYGSHLSSGRYIAFETLGFLSPLVHAGDTQAVSGLMRAWGLFVMACAVALFARAARQPVWVAAAMAALSTVAGWVANLLWVNNYDNGLALVYMPALAAVLRLADLRDLRWWGLAGALAAAALYTYPELALLAIAGGCSSVLPRLVREAGVWRGAVSGIGLALGVTVLLILPFATTLLGFVLGQFEIARVAGGRPGEGLFLGLLASEFQPAAFWGLGAEHQIHAFHEVRQVLAVVLSLLAGIGFVVLAREGHWGLAGAALVLVLGAIYLIVEAKYPYGAYKLIALNWWCLVAAVVIGSRWLLEQLRGPALRYGGATAALTAALLVMSQSYHADRNTSIQYGLDSPFQSLRMAQFRSLRNIKYTVHGAPVAVAVDDWYASEWAVYYLRDAPLFLLQYRSYMAFPHVVPLMDHCRIPPFEDVQYLLTDTSAGQSLLTKGNWELAWSDGPYRLWHSTRPAFALLSEVKNANGVERKANRSFFWMGQGDTTLVVFATREGILELDACFLPGPSVKGTGERRLMLKDSAGSEKEATLVGGEARLTAAVKPGRNEIVLRTLDQSDGQPLVNGDTRPLILGVQNLTVKWQEPLADATEPGASE